MPKPSSFWIAAAGSAALLAFAPAALAAGETSSPPGQTSATATQPAQNTTANPLEKMTAPRTTVQAEKAQFKKNHPTHPTHMKTRFGTKTGAQG